MPLVASADPGRHASGMVHSHRFATANTAVPFVNHDNTQLELTKQFLQSGFISVDIFSVSPIDEKSERTPMIRRAGNNVPQAMSSILEEGEQSGEVFIREVGQMAAPLDRAKPVLKPGSTARVDVVVRTRKIGHAFPGGTIDAFDIWLELEGRDADGRVVFWSGQVADDPNGGKGPVEKGAHFYKAYQLDDQGNPINKRNAWQARSVLYVRAIPPGAADVAHYRIRIPEDARGPITLTAKLNYRKFSHYYTQFAYAGQPQPGQDGKITKHFNSAEYSFAPSNIPKNVSGQIKDRIPDLPIIVLAEAEATLQLGNASTVTQWTQVTEKPDRERWNDWGIGMLLQGDLKGAEYAFKQVTKAEPGYADGWLNVARALIQEGETDAAKPYIEQALKIDSSLGRIYYFKGLIEKTDGDYDDALKSFRMASAKYPRDRVVLNQIARVLFLQRNYAEAVKACEHVALVDPEDVQMHYTAMLAYRGLGDTAAAERHQKLFMRFKVEEAAQAITGSRRLAEPEENNERQQIHDHESVPLPKMQLTERKPQPSIGNLGGS
jgi:tetratricopeptide (TPR) repeat protein